MAQRSILCSADSSHIIGKYWMREPEYGMMAHPTRSTINDSTYRTRIWKRKLILYANHKVTTKMAMILLAWWLQAIHSGNTVSYSGLVI
jgi:hypothetical protein